MVCGLVTFFWFGEIKHWDEPKKGRAARTNRYFPVRMIDENQFRFLAIQKDRHGTIIRIFVYRFKRIIMLNYFLKIYN